MESEREASAKIEAHRLIKDNFSREVYESSVIHRYTLRTCKVIQKGKVSLPPNFPQSLGK